MSLYFTELRHAIDDVLREIEIEYQHSQGLILTEDDLKCLLYKKLTEINSLSFPEPTQDQNIMANKVHSELSWYDENDMLAIRPDITILDPIHLSILHLIHGSAYTYLNEVGLSHLYNDRPLGSKQFSYGGKAIIFELKFIKNKGGIYRSTLRKLKADYDKMVRLFDRLDGQGHGHEIYGYQIILNKTDKKCRAFDDFLQENGSSDKHEIIYMTGNVEFP